MKILTREELFKQPDFTIFSVYKPCYFTGLYVFGGHFLRDFTQMSLIGNIDYESDLGDFIKVIEESIDNSTSFKLDFEDWMKNGLFDFDEMYAVYEEDDLKELRNIIDKALDNYKKK
jgi:hypothetical protein